MRDSVKKSLQISGCANEYKSGLTAVKNEHRRKIRVRDSRCLEGSMDIDKAHQKSELELTGGITWWW